MSKAVFAIARSDAQAVQMVDRLKAIGFSADAISVLYADRSGSHDLGLERHTKAPEGTAAGAGIGGLLGGAAGWLAGVGALMVPGIGPFLAAGPLMAALGGAALGAAAGGLGGALIGMGIPEFEARRYEGKLREGNILISVHTADAEERRLAHAVLQKAGAEDITVAGETRAEV